MKKIVPLILLMCILFTNSISTFAIPIDVPEGYGIQYSTPEYPFTIDYGPEENTIVENKSRSGVLEYGYVTSTSDVLVYTSTDRTTSIGFVGYRERVYVLYVAGSMYYIEFKNVNTLDRGFVDASKIYVPSYGWSRPITQGNITQDIGGTNNHSGIDVGVPEGTAVYAVKNYPHESRISTAVINGVTKFVNYGNHIVCNTGTNTIIYAHLSSFVRGTAATHESYRVKYTGSQDLDSQATWTPNTGDCIGSTGNTGWSTGPHLHFEVYNTSTGQKRDPFLFVVFPNTGY